MANNVPAIRSATTNFWEPRDPEPMLQFLETWEKLLPVAILQNILENLVMPKLVVAVDAWDPCQETVPIHAWLHPWLPLLGGRMEPLYHPIQFKLGNVLQAWHPSDSSALALLSLWHSVFDPSSWEHLLVWSILPKLMHAMQELRVNSAHEQLDQFNWVTAWGSAVPIHHMVLYNWLCANPNYQEVSRWYLGWKSWLPPELLENEGIRHQLNIALEMMNQALEGAPIVQAGTRENLSFLQATEHRLFQTPRYSAAHGQQQQQAAEMSLKEVVEAYAQDNDVQFLPKPGRTHEGLQVYGFGAVNVIVDAAKQVILAQNGNHWP
ncbi:unnamed protein product [Sphagnum jensenii]|uniref:GCF C-terminal domain-containing protein n=1 Tax=Sphagnum jensenii TaxID=128206 RepID=A0ABP1AWJ0_9BRYO